MRPGDYQVLVFLAFNFLLQRSQLSLTLPRSRFDDSATVTLTHGNGTTAIIGITNQLILKNGKKLRGVQEEQ